MKDGTVEGSDKFGLGTKRTIDFGGKCLVGFYGKQACKFITSIGFYVADPDVNTKDTVGFWSNNLDMPMLRTRLTNMDKLTTEQKDAF